MRLEKHQQGWVVSKIYLIYYLLLMLLIISAWCVIIVYYINENKIFAIIFEIS